MTMLQGHDESPTATKAALTMVVLAMFGFLLYFLSVAEHTPKTAAISVHETIR